MADPQDLEKLCQGPKAWNQWRAEEPNRTPDLRDARLTLSQRQLGPGNGGPVDLHGADLEGAELRNATLSGANLQVARLIASDLVHARLDGADLSGADLTDAVLDSADLTGANLNGAIVVGANLANVRGLTQTQIRTAHGDASTILPATLTPPESWLPVPDEEMFGGSPAPEDPIEESDPYQVLGISRSASQDEIRAAFRSQVKLFHPDLNPDNAEAQEVFKRISIAYRILGDPEKRARYDRGEIGGDGEITPDFEARQRFKRHAFRFYAAAAASLVLAIGALATVWYMVLVQDVSDNDRLRIAVAGPEKSDERLPIEARPPVALPEDSAVAGQGSKSEDSEEPQDRVAQQNAPLSASVPVPDQLTIAAAPVAAPIPAETVESETGRGQLDTERRIQAGTGNSASEAASSAKTDDEASESGPISAEAVIVPNPPSSNLSEAASETSEGAGEPQLADGNVGGGPGEDSAAAGEQILARADQGAVHERPEPDTAAISATTAQSSRPKSVSVNLAAIGPSPHPIENEPVARLAPQTAQPDQQGAKEDTSAVSAPRTPEPGTGRPSLVEARADEAEPRTETADLTAPVLVETSPHSDLLYPATGGARISKDPVSSVFTSRAIAVSVPESREGDATASLSMDSVPHDLPAGTEVWDMFTHASPNPQPDAPRPWPEMLKTQQAEKNPVRTATPAPTPIKAEAAPSPIEPSAEMRRQAVSDILAGGL